MVLFPTGSRLVKVSTSNRPLAGGPPTVSEPKGPPGFYFYFYFFPWLLFSQSVAAAKPLCCFQPVPPENLTSIPSTFHCRKPFLPFPSAAFFLAPPTTTTTTQQQSFLALWTKPRRRPSSTALLVQDTGTTRHHRLVLLTCASRRYRLRHGAIRSTSSPSDLGPFVVPPSPVAATLRSHACVNLAVPSSSRHRTARHSLPPPRLQTPSRSVAPLLSLLLAGPGLSKVPGPAQKVGASRFACLVHQAQASGNLAAVTVMRDMKMVS